MIAQLPVLHAAPAAPPWSPESVTGLSLWLKADAIEGLADGDPVASWLDASGHNRHAVQSVANQKPTYKAGVQNGRPAVLFDGVDDLLVAALGYRQDEPLTQLWAVKGFDDQNGLITCGGDFSFRAALTVGDPGRMYLLRNQDAENVQTGLAAPAAAILAVRYRGASSSYCKNGGAPIGFAGLGADYMDTYANIGATRWGGGGLSFGHVYVFEWLVYSGALSDADLAAAMAYLNERWGIF